MFRVQLVVALNALTGGAAAFMLIKAVYVGGMNNWITFAVFGVVFLVLFYFVGGYLPRRRREQTAAYMERAVPRPQTDRPPKAQ